LEEAAKRGARLRVTVREGRKNLSKGDALDQERGSTLKRGNNAGGPKGGQPRRQKSYCS